MPPKRKWTLGRGELTTITLAKELAADLTLIDDFAARRLAEREGFDRIRLHRGPRIGVPARLP
jgi:predicted nucleic acid-binding protein